MINKNTWPYSNAIDPDIYKEKMDWPKISIVTPSYNQGQFIEETILSILNQNYPNLEYIIIDGGSTDNTTEIIKNNEDIVDYWTSEKDNGAAEAIAKGFNLAKGEFINWLNSDDILFPNTLNSLNIIADKYPNYDVYAFMGMSMGTNGGYRTEMKNWAITPLRYLFQHFSFAQESTFLRRNFLISNNIEIDKTLSNVFDTKFYMEMLNKNARVLFIETYAGLIRHHPDAKTSIGVPNTDFLTLKELKNEKNFFFKMLHRLYISRFGFLFSIFNNKIGLAILLKITKTRSIKYDICRFIGYDIFSTENWEIIRKIKK